MAKLFSLYHLFFGLIFAATIVYDAVENANTLLNFFSYFTVLSMIILTIIFINLGVTNYRKSVFGLPTEEARAASAAYVIISAAVFIFLLSGRPEIKPVPWVNFIYHKLAPVVVAVAWILFPPKRKVNWKSPFFLVVFPAVYLGYVFIRGYITGWYPYYFFDPAKTTYLQMIIFAVEATAFGLIVSLAIIFAGNLLAGLSSKK